MLGEPTVIFPRRLTVGAAARGSRISFRSCENVANAMNISFNLRDLGSPAVRSKQTLWDALEADFAGGAMRGASSRGPAVVRGDCHPLVWGGDLGETVRGQRCFGIGVGVSTCNTNTSEPETGFMSASRTCVPETELSTERSN